MEEHKDDVSAAGRASSSSKSSASAGAVDLRHDGVAYLPTMKPEEVADNVGKFMYNGKIVMAHPFNTPVGPVPSFVAKTLTDKTKKASYADMISLHEYNSKTYAICLVPGYTKHVIRKVFDQFMAPPGP